MKRPTRWIPILISLTLLAIGVSLRIADPDIVQGLRLTVFDTFQRIQPRTYQDAPVRIVDLDDTTLEKMGQWPWPRTRVAALVERLTELGAKGLLPELVFSDTYHGGIDPQLYQKWDGKNWKTISDWIPPYEDLVKAEIKKAAAEYRKQTTKK